MWAAGRRRPCISAKDMAASGRGTGAPSPPTPKALWPLPVNLGRGNFAQTLKRAQQHAGVSADPSPAHLSDTHPNAFLYYFFFLLLFPEAILAVREILTK